MPDWIIVGTNIDLGVFLVLRHHTSVTLKHLECYIYNVVSVLNEVSVREYLRKLVDDEGLRIVEAIPTREITDEEIADLTDIKLNSVRKVLYILYENRMANYRRQRNDETGWLTYIWKVNIDDLDDLIKDEIDKLLKNMKQRLESEKNNVFYVCSSGCGRLMFDAAASTEFKCPICDSPLQYEDNKLIVDALEKRINQLGD